MITTDVVPSPTSESCMGRGVGARLTMGASVELRISPALTLACNSARSTSTLAAGWSTSSSFKIVAPSFVIVMSPMLSTCGKGRGSSWAKNAQGPYAEPTSILSKPTGPRLLLTMLARATQAVTARRGGSKQVLPRREVFLVPQAFQQARGRALPPQVRPRTILCTNVLSCGGSAGSEGAASTRGGTLGKVLNTPVAGKRT